MHSNLLGSVSARAILLASLILGTTGVGTAAAQDLNDITLQLSSTTGNPGDTIEVTMTLVADEVLPGSMIVFFTYDPEVLTPLEDAYELVVRDPLSGDPILDGNGNTIATFSTLRPSENLRASGKGTDLEVYGDEGVVGLSITGGQLEMTPGELFTMAFTVSAGAEDGTTTSINGVGEGSEVLLPNGSGGFNVLVTSVARTGDGGEEDVTYDFEDVLVPIGCVPPVAPGGITATQNLNESVALTWSAVAGENIEYRVYRSTTNSAASAAPIGEGWQTEATFSDITALLPQTTAGEGCNAPDVTTEVHYFYWVKARSEEGCESPLSATPAEGFRTGSAARSAAVGSAFAGLLLLLVLSGMPARPGRATAR